MLFVLFLNGFSNWMDCLRAAVSSDVKQKVTLRGVSLKQCNQMYQRFRITVNSNQICAGGQKGFDSCRGRLFSNIFELSRIFGTERDFGTSTCHVSSSIFWTSRISLRLISIFKLQHLFQTLKPFCDLGRHFQVKSPVSNLDAMFWTYAIFKCWHHFQTKVSPSNLATILKSDHDFLTWKSDFRNTSNFEWYSRISVMSFLDSNEPF